jgi:hypothetical protein
MLGTHSSLSIPSSNPSYRTSNALAHGRSAPALPAARDRHMKSVAILQLPFGQKDRSPSLLCSPLPQNKSVQKQ